MNIDLVVVGLGYVGLPLVQEAAKSGMSVRGFDVSERVVSGLNSGVSHVDDLSDADIEEILATGFGATSDPAVLADAKAIVICVPTPLSEAGGPDLGAVTSAARVVSAHLQPGQLVVLESTTYPGTTEEIMVPILEESGLKVGADVKVAFSPERIDPGNAKFGLRNTPKIVGGIDEASTEAAEALYSQVVDTVVRAKGAAEAEAAKLLENTYRHVNIAMVNELARAFHELGIDIWDVINLASTKPFGFQAFYPGVGVGGHCIPIDPNYLSYHVRERLGYPFRFVELAEEVNITAPAYAARRAQDLLNTKGKAMNGSRVLVLGVTYKPNIADQRESPAVPLAQNLLDMGADLQYHDPHVAEWHVGDATFTSVGDAYVAAAEADIVILVQDHQAYDIARLEEASALMLDTKGKTSGTAERL